MTITVAVDAMGGDHGLAVTLPAALKFLEEFPDARVILVGLETPLTQALAKARSSARDRIAIHAATEVVAMDEPPGDALRRKKNSSMRVAINLVKDGTAQACVSAGNTGALMAIARFVLKTLPGIDRPAIASQFGGLLDHVGTLDVFFADIEQAHARSFNVFDRRDQRTAHHGKLHQLLGRAIDVGTEIERGGDALAGG